MPHNASASIHTIYLSLGSNLADRRSNLEAALQHLRQIIEIDIVSSVYETVPVGYLNQPKFFNMACRGTTQLSPQKLLKSIKEIEVAIGRQVSFQNGPRLIDIDIIFFDDLRVIEENLIIPHPRMAERAFVLAPIAEIAPNMTDPVSGYTVRDLLSRISLDGVKKLPPDLSVLPKRDI